MLNFLRSPALLLLCWIVLGCECVGAAEAKRPVIAVISTAIDRASPLVAMVETRLSQDDRWVIVDREHIAELTREWELAAISGASATAKRVEMGRLLGANLLVLVAEVDEPVARAEVVICETAHGIRLRSASVPTAQGPEQAVVAIGQEIEAATKKQAEGVVRICAVPPLVSMDLSATHDHLKIAYARMLETMLLQIPGTLVVELAEARQIAAEMEQVGTMVDRTLPMYFLGEYRFDAANPEMPPFLRMLAKQGEREVGVLEAQNMAPDEAAGFFRKAVMSLLGQESGEPLPASDLKIEAQLLAARANQYFVLGYYQECVQVAEASLLLDSAQPDLHRLAMVAYSRYARKNKLPTIQALPYYDLALVHMEQCLIQTHLEKRDPGLWQALLESFREIPYMTNQADEPTTAAVHAHRKRSQNAYLRVLDAKYRNGTLNDAMLNMIFHHWNNWLGAYNQPPREHFQQRLDVADIILGAKLKNPHWYICKLLDDGLSHAVIQSADYAWFTGQLKQRDHPAVAAGFKKLADDEAYKAKRQVEKKMARQEAIKKLPNTEPTGPIEIEFVPLKIQDPQYGSLQWSGMLRCGGDVDLFWGQSGVYLMRSIGVAEKLVDLSGQRWFGQACYDGKYAWLPLGDGQACVLAIKIDDGSVVRFTAEDGVQPFLGATAATIGQGRLCMTAWMRKAVVDRNYIAVLELADDGTKKFRIIHEATKQAVHGHADNDDKLDARRAFVPKFMVSEPTADGSSWRALVNRGPTSLWIDPDAGKVEAIDVGTGGIPDLNDITLHDHAVYYSSGALYRMRVGSRAKDRVRDLPENGSGAERVLIRDGKLHVVGWFWWVADGVDQPLRKLQGKVPGRLYDLRQLFDSAHYGVILRSRTGGEKTYQVKFIRHDDGGRSRQ